ncbi:hypothetical protein GCM10010472_56930 [Pseudonocardia halophobica]|uniref:OsmC-like protein n=1 Tax=Pseudonocardia halophobica TaxID=29401 RepID=A0A9W6P0G1_9PSEU|nr:OsmC family protein [Pseudonocardia halophobica]GLL15581.1 hypothetical protein GCM10017577_67330 [Pseudonocardia halophobica]
MKVDLGFDAGVLTELIDRVRSEPEAGATVWKAGTRWEKGLRSRAVIARPDKEHVVPMDEPTVLGGSDSAPNMVEVVLGAYGCCLTTGFVANAALRGIELEGVDIEIEGELDLQGFFGLRDPDEVWPGYTDVRATVSLRAPTATREQLEELFTAVVPTSPVGSIISRPVRLRTELG